MLTVSVVGEVFDGRYRLQQRLGGQRDVGVFRADDLSLARSVVLRIAGPEAEPALARQARCLRSLQFDSSHVVSVLDEGMTPDGGRYIATNLIEGTSLDQLAATRGPLPADEAALIGLQLLDAALAARRVVPEGLNTVPASAIVDRDGLLRVTRFEDQTTVGPQDPACPMTATLLHELLTGVEPRAGESVADRGRSVPQGVTEVIDQTLAGTILTAEELRGRLSEARKRIPQAVPSPPPPLRLWHVVTAVIVLLAITVAVIAAVIFGG